MLRWSGLALVIFALQLSAAELSIGQGLLAPGKPLDLNVTLADTGDAPTGVQFDVEYDAASFDVTIQAGPAASQASKTLQSAKLQAGKLRVLIIGFNKNMISDGVVAILHVTYKGEAVGKVFPIRVTGAAGTNQKAEPVKVIGKDGSVKVEIGRNEQ